MASITCNNCGHVVNDKDHLDMKLMNDIHKWVNYILSVQLSHGETASRINVMKACPACPKCQAKAGWSNVISE